MNNRWWWLRDEWKLGWKRIDFIQIILVGEFGSDMFAIFIALHGEVSIRWRWMGDGWI